jgi:hypothetical protein
MNEVTEDALMARPFVVHYLIFCDTVEYLDPNRPHRDSTLNRVDYVLPAPPNTEFPFEPPEFWLFARFYWLRNRPGSTAPLTVSCVWHDSPTGDEVEAWQRHIGRVRFLRPNDVIDRAWAFRNHPDAAPYRFPGIGRYEFRLWYPHQQGLGRRVVSSEHIRVEI